MSLDSKTQMANILLAFRMERTSFSVGSTRYFRMTSVRDISSCEGQKQARSWDMRFMGTLRDTTLEQSNWSWRAGLQRRLLKRRTGKGVVV